MIRLLLIILSLFLITPAFAAEKIKYKNLKENCKITFKDGAWTTKVKRKTDNYYIKRISEGVSNFSEFYSPAGEFLFSTATEYEFINKGRLIGYSNEDLKFYEFIFQEGLLTQREMTEGEVQELFPKYRIIEISEFSRATNCLKLKKNCGKLKLILLNDTDGYFYNYVFTTNNAKYEKYTLRGFLNITQKGLIHFSYDGKDVENTPWFVLLIR